MDNNIKVLKKLIGVNLVSNFSMIFMCFMKTMDEGPKKSSWTSLMSLVRL